MAIANQTKTIVGVFNSVQDAHAAVRELESQGISRDEISIVANKNATGYDTMEDRDKTSDVVADAGIGAAIGGVGGLLLSAAGAITVPVIGPILAAGPIAAALTGAGIGAAAGGLIGALTESGIPENEAKYYAEGVRRGDVLVTVKTDEARADRVCDVLDRHDAVDVDDRVQNWKTRGWSGWDSSAEPYTSEDLQKERSYYRSGKDPAVSGQVGGIGTEGLPTPYDERTDRSTIGTTGMSGAGLTGGTGSGYAGQPSGHVSGRDLSDPRDRDKDGWVADDKMRDAGRSAKRGAREMKEDAKDMFRDREHDRPLGTTASDTATDPRDKDRDGWVADDKMREWGRDIKDAVSGTGNKLKQQGRELREEARDTEQSMEAERRRRARVYDRTLL
jgi:uncharacterized membrane protein/Sec-independent protein translocase protein TatA